MIIIGDIVRVGQHRRLFIVTEVHALCASVITLHEAQVGKRDPIKQWYPCSELKIVGHQRLSTQYRAVYGD